LAAVLLAALGHDTLLAQASEVYARLAAGNQVERIDPVTGAARTVYRSPRWAALSLTVAPHGQLLGLLEVDQGSENNDTVRHTALVVLDSSGRLLHRVARDVHRYVWCGPECVAFVRGQFAETDYGFMPGHGLFVHDLRTGTTTEHASSQRPYELVFASFDSSVYFKDAGPARGIHRLELSSQRVTPTALRDLVFSRDGRYYLRLPDAIDRHMRLLDSRTNREVALPRSVGQAIGWAPTGGAQLLVVKPLPTPPAHGGDRGGPLVALGPAEQEREFGVFDVDERRVVRVVRGVLPRWSASSGVIPMIVRGRVEALKER
jgi:hypothetical protein